MIHSREAPVDSTRTPRTGTYGDDAPAYRLVRYAADSRVLGGLKVPAGTPWGQLL
ncbi:hypothetical protein [Micromonospora sp. S4605]|uniref:hypothetical protein n=1 Tax=Micromonospora sp. S4605 TaxID=1420897 RepID=UPI001305098D|nr:hypothetical protein [Micromonospora sp. S4605]